MIEKPLKLKNRLGLHARAAAKLVHTAAAFQARVTIAKGDNEVDGKSILGILLLAGAQGDSLLVRAEGPDEGAALSALETLVDQRFGEMD